MNVHSQPRSVHGDESGQAAAVIALLLFFAFLAFAALAIDGSMTYLARRDLQNVADSAALAACRVLAQNDTTTTPLDAAKNAITSNLGSWATYAGSNPPGTNVGAGVGLLKGIEVANPEVEVRVALQRKVPTVLTQFVGRGDSIMVAQARCDTRAGGGLMPIAIQRYDGETGGSLRDYLGNKSASGYPPAAPPVPYPTDSVTVTIPSPPARYPPYFQVPVPMSQYAASDGVLADSQTGPEVVLLGQSADTNNNTSSMRNLVLLDIRNVASQNALEYYNGADSQADAAKDMSQQWIYMHGYPGPYPQVGSQVAILDGASNNFTARAMSTAGYRPGDVVAAIVYDGFVWTRPDFSVALTPSDGISSGYPIDSGTAVVYTLNIAKAGPASAAWFSSLDFNLSFDFTNKPLPTGSHVTLDGVELLPPNYAYTKSGVTQAGWNGTVRIWSTQAITQVKYLTGIDLFAESNLGLTHGASSNYGFGSGAINPDYTARTNSGKLVIRRSNTSSANLITLGIGNSIPGGGCTNVPVQASVLLGGTPQSWNSFFTSSSSTSVKVKQNIDQSANLALTASSTAFIGAGYTLRLTVGPKTCSGNTLSQRTVDIPLEIKPPAPTAMPDKFVIIQGYAVFRISRADANDVWGYAISPLYESYQEIRYGLRPRLVPWN